MSPWAHAEFHRLQHEPYGLTLEPTGPCVASCTCGAAVPPAAASLPLLAVKSLVGASRMSTTPLPAGKIWDNLKKIKEKNLVGM